MTRAVSTDWFERPSATARHRRPEIEAEQALPGQRVDQQWQIEAPTNGRIDTVPTRRSGARLTGPGVGRGMVTEPSSGVGPVTIDDLEERAVLFGYDWPLRSYLELGSLASAVPCARLHAREVVKHWRLDVFADTAELIVSELVTNAMQASETLRSHRFNGRWAPGRPPVRLWLSSDQQQVLIQVWDANELLPVRQAMAEPDDESGRGLLLVEALCQRYGVYRLERANGKVVWAAS
jgi:anti-sigma regulatory factor (Ser/Thr protein kinase)